MRTSTRQEVDDSALLESKKRYGSTFDNIYDLLRHVPIFQLCLEKQPFFSAGHRHRAGSGRKRGYFVGRMEEKWVILWDVLSHGKENKVYFVGRVVTLNREKEAREVDDSVLLAKKKRHGFMFDNTFESTNSEPYLYIYFRCIIEIWKNLTCILSI